MSLQEKSLQTDRIKIAYYELGDEKNPTVFLIHGNVSSKSFWEETAANLSREYNVIAPDLRGFGNTEELPIDATQGVCVWSDDLKSFKEALGIKEKVHLVGWSVGGAVVMQYAIDHPEDIASLTLESPMSPFGFGGTKDEKGTPCHENYAGSGGGTANPDFVKLIKNGDMTGDDANSPRMVMNQFYFRPPFSAGKEREDKYVRSMLTTKIADDHYPGTLETCEEWPGVSPGDKGINNAISPKYVNLSAFANIEHKIPVLWIRGENDLIVSDQSFLDFGFLGKSGYVPGWPGDDVFPPQPMVSQMRYVLDQYKNNGNEYVEFVMPDTGHSPHIEKPEVYEEKVLSFLKINSGTVQK